MSPIVHCHTCRFFIRRSEKKNYGHCHRYAPRPVEVETHPLEGIDENMPRRPEWPEVHFTDFCGDYQDGGERIGIIET
jgi:hypothetical protein